MAGLRQIIDAAEGAFTTGLAGFDATGDGQVLHGAASTHTWLRGALGMASGEASERVAIARRTRAGGLPSGAESFPGSFEQIRAIHRYTKSLPPSARDDATSTLTGLSRDLGVDDLRAVGRHLRHVVDPDGSERHAEEDHGRRWLTMASLLDGMHSIDGVLDAETAGHLSTALAPFLVPSGSDDTRTTCQRRADGLAELVNTAIATQHLPTLSGATASLQVEVSLATLAADSPLPARLHSTCATPVMLAPNLEAKVAGAALAQGACDPVRASRLGAGGVVRPHTSSISSIVNTSPSDRSPGGYRTLTTWQGLGDGLRPQSGSFAPGGYRLSICPARSAIVAARSASRSALYGMEPSVMACSSSTAAR